MNGNTKEYRDLQVEFAPGIYGGLSAASVFAFLLLGHWLFAVAAWLLIGFIFYRDKPLRFLLRGQLLLSVLASFLFCLGTVAPTFILSMQYSAFSELVGMLLIPIGGVSLSIFLLKFYTHERLKENGWVNISGRFN